MGEFEAEEAKQPTKSVAELGAKPQAYRKPYGKPQLVCHGDVRDVTLGGSPAPEVDTQGFGFRAG